MNRNIRIKDDEGDGSAIYPCTILLDVENKIYVAYTGFRRFMQSLL